MRSKFSLIGIFLVLISINLMIATKETALARGRTVIMKLAPVDPRSLMQGDYMRLGYALASEVPAGSNDAGTVYVSLDSRNVATSVSPSPAEGLVPLKYRRIDGRVVFDVESYFFQEGQGRAYAAAQYGELKVDGQGTPLLVDLLDAQLHPINP